MRPERAAQILAEVGLLLLVIVLILRGLSMSNTLQSTPSDAPADVDQPYLGDYSFTRDGKQFHFRQGLIQPDIDANKILNPTWYMARLGESLLVESERPTEDILPFLLQNNRLFLMVGSGADLTTGSPADMVVRSHVLSPDGNLMAFTAYRPGEKVGLYILNKKAELSWLGDEVDIYDLSWSPDGEYLAFVAPREQINQVFRIDRTGVSLEQLTFDPVNKDHPVWGSDQDTLVFLAEQPPGSSPRMEAALQQTPTAEIAGEPPEMKIGLYVWRRDAPEISLLTGGLPEATHLYRADLQAGIVFSAPLVDWPEYQALYLIDPQNGEQRQAYPPLSVDAILCPERADARSEIPVQIAFSNNTQTPSSLPVILRSSAIPLSILVEDRTRDARRIESIDLQGEEAQQVEWMAPASPGLVTHISVMADLGSPFPMSEQHCQVANTYMGLPNLDFLDWILPLGVPGLLLVLPWTLQRKKVWLWALWPLYPVLVSLLVVIEIGLVK